MGRPGRLNLSVEKPQIHSSSRPVVRTPAPERPAELSAPEESPKQNSFSRAPPHMFSPRGRPAPRGGYCSPPLHSDGYLEAGGPAINRAHPRLHGQRCVCFLGEQMHKEVVIDKITGCPGSYGGPLSRGLL